MSKDLTAIVIRLVPPPPDTEFPATAGWIESVVRQRDKPAILRIAPLPGLGLIQCEVSNTTDGMPTEDPELIAALSARGQASFLHVNHEAQQAILHGFDGGTALEGFVGKPDAEFEGKLMERFGANLEGLHAADDQTRAGIGIVASRTAALLPGRSLSLPIGMPSGLGTFTFHDRGAEAGPDTERCTFFAFDKPLIDALCKTPGVELARIIESARQGQDAESEHVIAVLKQLDQKPLVEAPQTERRALVRAVEMMVLGSGRVFAGGDRAGYWEERVLPLLSLESSMPVIDDDDLESLDEAKSVLHALVEVVPSAAPPGGAGQVMEGVGDVELSPLLPAFAEDGTYAGSVLRLDPARLVAQLRSLQGDSLSQAVMRIETSWFTKKTGLPPEGEAFDAFRKANSDKGQPDVDRVLRHMSELRVVLEVALVNDLTVALAFYG